MQPSSLIFLVILGVWAAYFLHFWMRRREMIATARTVDRFSETMRVLSVRTDDLRRSAAPSRRMAPPAGVSLRARTSASVEVRTAALDGSAVGAPLLRPGKVAARPGIPHISEGAVAMSPRRSLRGILLLVGLLGTLVFTVLAAAGVIRWVGLVVPVVMLVAGFLWLRQGVRSEAEARAAARRAARATGAARPAGTAPRRPERVGVGVGVHPRRDLRDDPAGDPVAEVTAPAERADEVFDGNPAASAAATARAAGARRPAEPTPDTTTETHDDDLPLTWEPRAVPTPTYAMKARVEHREAAPVAALPRLEELAAFEDDVVPLRPRAANG